MIKKFDFDLIKNTEKLLKINGLENKKFLLGVSGGMDSVVLLHHLLKVKAKVKTSPTGLQLFVCYVHHGVTSDEKQNNYRNRALSFVQKLSLMNSVPFFTNEISKNEPSTGSSDSEEYFRTLRDNFFKKIMIENNIDVLVKAHNRDDLLETRLIRLLRGVGAQGLMAMSEMDGNTFRPLLTWTRASIENYISEYNLDFIHDPSNEDEKYFRNWIRHSWLKDLENYRPGAKSSLMRSLENVSDTLQSSLKNSSCGFLSTIESVIGSEGIIRNKLISLNKLDQRRVFALYLNKMNIKNYSHSQIDEILKRLDSSKKELKFNVAGCSWKVDTQHISICEQ